MDSHAFEVEVHDFITCLWDPTLEPVIASNNIAALILKVIVNTQSLISYAKVHSPQFVQLNKDSAL